MMRILSFVLLLVTVSVVAHGQDPPATFGNNIRREDVLKLPPNRAPRLSMQRALRIAQRFVFKKKLDVSSCYLWKAELMPLESNATENAWRFWWVRTIPRHDKPDIIITVSMDGVAAHTPSPGAT